MLEDFLKFGIIVKKKVYDLYGVFYKDVDMIKKVIKIIF